MSSKIMQMAGWILLFAMLASACSPAGIASQIPAQKKATVIGVADTPTAEATRVPATLQPTQSPTITAAPTVEPSLTANPKPAQPAIINTYTVSNMPLKGGGMGAMLVMPGRIWLGTMFSGLQLWDPVTGSVVKTYSDIKAKIYWDIKFDGRYLWVLASEETGSDADSLYVIDPNKNELVKRFEIGMVGSYGWEPTRLGYSSGTIWVNDGTISTDTLEYTRYSDGLPAGANFAYDNNGWMWVTGSWCDGCRHSLWILKADDPQTHRDNQHSGILGESVMGKPLILAGERIWLIAVVHDSNQHPIYYLEAYFPDKSDIPTIHQDVSAELPVNSDIHLAADNKVLWIEAESTLFYYSLENAQLQGSLPVGKDVQSIGYDGVDLWVLSSKEGLQQISLPW